MTYEQIFEKVKKSFIKATAKNFSDSFAFQFNITGEGEGIFYVCFKDGVLEVEPYDYKDRDVIFTADGATFIAIAEGKLEPITAINEGKLFIDGNFELSKQLIGMIPAKKAAKKPAAKTETKKAAAKTETKKAAAKKCAPKAAEKKAEAPKAAAKTEEKKAEAKTETKKAATPKAAAKKAEKPAEKKTEAAKTTKASK